MDPSEDYKLQLREKSQRAGIDRKLF